MNTNDSRVDNHQAFGKSRHPDNKSPLLVRTFRSVSIKQPKNC